MTKIPLRQRRNYQIAMYIAEDIVEYLTEGKNEAESLVLQRQAAEGGLFVEAYRRCFDDASLSEPASEVKFD